MRYLFQVKDSGRIVPIEANNIEAAKKEFLENNVVINKIMKKVYTLRIDAELLHKQIHDMLESNIPEKSKAGLHNLLGDILDQAEVR